jgi:uncharacterized protein (DUF2235 family)
MKRLALFADGTWNIRDQLDKSSGHRRPTNVTKLARAVISRADVDQIVFYHEGVGTNGGLDRWTGGAFGQGLEDNVRTLYRFLVYNHEQGDEIYLFGFSRGAFTVRTLAGFLRCVGLVEKQHDYFVPELYACYANQVAPGSAAWKHAFRKIPTPPPVPTITMIGVWDTVGALGAPGVVGQLRKARYAFHDVTLFPQVLHAYHAMAIDERRKSFLPTLWQRPPGWKGELIQAWFPGVHSNVGGSYTPDGLANEALHWMAKRAAALGLRFDAPYLAPFQPRFDSKLHDSMAAVYRLMGQVQRPIGEASAHGERIHQSAVDRLSRADLGYRPANLQTVQARALPVEPR